MAHDPVIPSDWIKWQRTVIKAKVLTPVVRMQIKQDADFTCTYCRRRGGLMLDPDGARWHMDHITPLTRTQDIGLRNVALACRACNVAKRNRTPEEWASADPS